MMDGSAFGKEIKKLLLFAIVASLVVGTVVGMGVHWFYNRIDGKVNIEFKKEVIYETVTTDTLDVCSGEEVPGEETCGCGAGE